MKRIGAVLVSAFALGLMVGCEPGTDEMDPAGTEIIEDTNDISPLDEGYGTDVDADADIDSGIDTDPGLGNDAFRTEPSEAATDADVDLDLGDLGTDQGSAQSAPDVDEAPAVEEEPATTLPE